VQGLHAAGNAGHAIHLSPRSEARSRALAARYERVVREDSNAAAVAKSDVVFLAVRPQQMRELVGLRFRAEQIVVSFLAGTAIDQLRPFVAPATRLVPDRRSQLRIRLCDHWVDVVSFRAPERRARLVEDADGSRRAGCALRSLLFCWTRCYRSGRRPRRTIDRCGGLRDPRRFERSLQDLPQSPLCPPAIALAPPQAVEDGDQIIDSGGSVFSGLQTLSLQHDATRRFLGNSNGDY
jgi:hypothetical protein